MKFTKIEPGSTSENAEVESQRCVPGPVGLVVASFHSTIGCHVWTSNGLIHVSSVMPGPAPTSRLELPGVCTYPLEGLKAKACPTIPGLNAMPPTALALFGPALSSVFPSPFHQLTKPLGEETHLLAGKTVRSALELVAIPKALD